MTPAGPSNDYRELLAGRIEPDEYVVRLKALVDARAERRRFEPAWLAALTKYAKPAKNV